MASPGVLTDRQIKETCSSSSGSGERSSSPIKGYLAKQVKTASYDLRLGRQYYYRRADDNSEVAAVQALDVRETLTLPANAVVVVSTMERLKLTNDMIGHLSLKMDLLRQGVIMASQSQIDAGYEGDVLALLYNLSDESVRVKQGDAIIRLELVRLPEAVEKTYSGDYQNQNLQAMLAKPLRSSLDKMRRDVDDATEKSDASAQKISEAREELQADIDQARERVENTRIWGAGIGLAAAVIPILVVLGSGVYNQLDHQRDSNNELQNRVSKLEGQIGVLQADQSATDQKTAARSLEEQCRQAVRQQIALADDRLPKC